MAAERLTVKETFRITEKEAQNLKISAKDTDKAKLIRKTLQAAGII